MDYPLEGWLQLNDLPDNLIQVKLVDYSSGGVDVLFSSDAAVHPGQCGDLITQAHGAGCCQRPVRCTWCKPHRVNRRLQRAGFSFEVN